MIRYTLRCDGLHSFEAWFRNSDDYDGQHGRGLVSCPVCGSSEVEKQLMAPAVSTSRSRENRVAVPVPDAAASPVPEANATTPQSASEGVAPMPAALLPSNERQRELVAALKALRTKMIEGSENVGKNFAEEARKMHFGESEERSIYGETSRQDALDLLDEGIAVIPLPEIPDDKN